MGKKQWLYLKQYAAFKKKLMWNFSNANNTLLSVLLKYINFSGRNYFQMLCCLLKLLISNARLAK